MDVLVLIVNGTAFLLRVVVIANTLAGGQYQLQTVSAAQLDLLVVGFVLIVIRYVEMLTFFPAMGEVFTMTLAMVSESLPVFAFMLLIAMATGVALSAALPPIVPADEITWPNYPLVAGMWAMLGMFNFVDIMFTITEDEVQSRTWLPVLFWLEGFVTTVLLVNLMSTRLGGKDALSFTPAAQPA